VTAPERRPCAPRVFDSLLGHDTDCAPHPFRGWCILAGCKPRIRKSAEVGDRVVGATPKADGSRVGDVMRVDAKVPVCDPWDDRRFLRKRRVGHPSTPVEECGDNLRKPRDDDPRSAHVLASRRFAHDGSKPRDRPRTLRALQMAARSHLVSHAPEPMRALLRFVRACRRGVRSPPGSWAEDDATSCTASRGRSCV
jgi:hypothetical protein